MIESGTQEQTFPKIRIPDNISVAVVIPSFNEVKSIVGQIEKIQSALGSTEWIYDIIVVDDGSTDGTASAAERCDVQVIRLPKNRGYGAALKAGISVANASHIVIIDADGTYPAEAIPEMLRLAEHYDMVVGARVGDNVHMPVARKPAKWFLGKLASYLAGQKIPDLNSGLRVMKRSVVKQFYNILPSGFSFTTMITLAHLCNDFLVYYHPIEYYTRIGRSKIRPVHAYHFLLLILRTIVYFNPLKVFLPLGAFLFLTGLGKFIYDLFIGNLSESAILGFLGSLIVWAIGLLSDQIAKVGIANRSN